MEAPLDLRVGLIAVGPQHPIPEAETVEQVGGGLAADRDPELVLEDPADLGAEGADSIRGPSGGVEPLLEPGGVFGIQASRSSGAGAFGERFDATAVVLGDPVLDGATMPMNGVNPR